MPKTPLKFPTRTTPDGAANSDAQNPPTSWYLPVDFWPCNTRACRDISSASTHAYAGVEHCRTRAQAASVSNVHVEILTRSVRRVSMCARIAHLAMGAGVVVDFANAPRARGAGLASRCATATPHALDVSPDC